MEIPNAKFLQENNERDKKKKQLWVFNSKNSIIAIFFSFHEIMTF